MTDKAGITIPKTVLLRAQEFAQRWGTSSRAAWLLWNIGGGRNVIASACARGAAGDTAVKLGLALE